MRLKYGSVSCRKRLGMTKLFVQLWYGLYLRARDVIDSSLAICSMSDKDAHTSTSGSRGRTAQPQGEPLYQLDRGTSRKRRQISWGPSTYLVISLAELEARLEERTTHNPHAGVRVFQFRISGHPFPSRQLGLPISGTRKVWLLSLSYSLYFELGLLSDAGFQTSRNARSSWHRRFSPILGSASGITSHPVPAHKLTFTPSRSPWR